MVNQVWFMMRLDPKLSIISRMVNDGDLLQEEILQLSTMYSVTLLRVVQIIAA